MRFCSENSGNFGKTIWFTGNISPQSILKPPESQRLHLEPLRGAGAPSERLQDPRHPRRDRSRFRGHSRPQASFLSASRLRFEPVIDLKWTYAMSGPWPCFRFRNDAFTHRSSTKCAQNRTFQAKSLLEYFTQVECITEMMFIEKCKFILKISLIRAQKRSFCAYTRSGKEHVKAPTHPQAGRFRTRRLIWHVFMI